MRPKKKKLTKSKTEAAPVAEEVKKAVHKKPREQACGDAIKRGKEQKIEPEAQHSSDERNEHLKFNASAEVLYGDLLRYLGDTEQPQNPGIVTVKNRIYSDVLWLFKKAEKKDTLAFNALLESSLWASHLIRHIAKAEFEFVKSAARRSTFWPVTISKSPSFPEKVDLLRKKLELGKDDDAPFDIFKRFAGKSHGPTRALLMQALLVIETCRQLSFHRSQAIKIGLTGKALKECLTSGEVPKNELPRTNKELEILKAACAQELNLEQCFASDLPGKFEKLVNLLDVRVGKELSPAKMWIVLVTDRNFPVIQLRLPMVGNNPLLAPLKLKEILLSIGQLPPMSAASKHDWYALMEKLIFVSCGDTPLASQAIRIIGKSGKDKSLLQAASGDVSRLPALKKKLNHKKSPDTNILDTALRVLKKAFFKMTPDVVARETVAGSKYATSNESSAQPHK